MKELNLMQAIAMSIYWIVFVTPFFFSSLNWYKCEKGWHRLVVLIGGLAGGVMLAAFIVNHFIDTGLLISVY